MTPTRVYQSATELPPELISIGSLNAYEDGPDHVRLACRLSDPNYEVGQIAILRVSMVTFAVEVEYTADQFFMGFHSTQGRDLLVETGGYVRRNSGSGFQMEKIGAEFLQDCFSLPETDFVFGTNGDIFRSLRDGAWTRDRTPTTERVLAMAGSSEDFLFAAGSNGLLMTHRQQDWERIDLGIGTDLRCLRTRGDHVLLGGDRGLSGALADGEFRLFRTGIESDFLSIAEFRGQTYFADSDYGLHRLEGNAFIPVAELGYVYRVNGGQTWLTADAGEYVFQFNGSDWRGIEIVYRGGYFAEPFDMSFLS